MDDWRIRLIVGFVAIAALLGACSSEADEDLTLAERCRRDVEELLEKHDLPLGADEEVSAERCEEDLAEQGIDSAAEWEIYRRQLDKELRELSD